MHQLPWWYSTVGRISREWQHRAILYVKGAVDAEVWGYQHSPICHVLSLLLHQVFDALTNACATSGAAAELSEHGVKLLPIMLADIAR